MLTQLPQDPHSQIQMFLANRPATTARAYAKDLAGWLDFCGGGDPDHWTAVQMLAWQESLAGLSSSTINRKVSALKSFMKWRKQIQESPAEVMKTTKNPTTPKASKWLGEGDVALILDRIPPGTGRSICELIYATGLRVSEVANLTWDNVFDHGDTVVITVLGKGAKVRSLTLRSEQWIAIAGASKGVGYIFQTRTGKPWDQGRIHRLLSTAAGRATGAHALRHAHAQSALAHGCPLPTLQQSLGHSSLKTTGIYLQSRPGDSSALYL